jgi:hypothetical protein
MTRSFPSTPVRADEPAVPVPVDLEGTGFRASPSLAKVHRSLGLLAELPGHWVGQGFNLIARPNRRHIFFLELNPTKETLDFTTIGGSIPNRGSAQADIDVHGLHYLQQVSDRRSDTGIHIEPGLWIRVPKTTDPHVAHDTYVRQATIPHGDSLLAQSVQTQTVPGGPSIQPLDSTPFTGPMPELNESPKHPETDPAYLAPYRDRTLGDSLPAGLKDSDVIKNPALLLTHAIADQTIIETVVLSISTDPIGGIVNIPFVKRNANAVRLDAIFWIETVHDPAHGEFMQLQYMQRVILNFSGIHWPHLSVATLRKQ